MSFSKNKQTPLVSIVIPFYNPGKFFKFTLESLQNLKYKNTEFIFVDDGSTDNSKKVLKKYFKKEYKLIEQRNSGVNNLYKTINKGLQISNGKYLQMFPSDDLIYANKLEKQVEILETYKNVSLVFSRMHLIDEKNKRIGSAYIPKEFYKNQLFTEKTLLEKLYKTYFIPQLTTLIRKKKLLEIGGFIQPNGLFAEDMPTHLNLLAKGDFYFLNNYNCAYRIHSNQMTKKHSENMILTDSLYLTNHLKKRNKVLKIKNLNKLIVRKQRFDLIRLGSRNPFKALKFGTKEFKVNLFIRFFIFILSTFIFIFKIIFPQFMSFRFRKKIL